MAAGGGRLQPLPGPEHGAGMVRGECDNTAEVAAPRGSEQPLGRGGSEAQRTAEPEKRGSEPPAPALPLPTAPSFHGKHRTGMRAGEGYAALGVPCGRELQRSQMGFLPQPRCALSDTRGV